MLGESQRYNSWYQLSSVPQRCTEDRKIFCSLAGFATPEFDGAHQMAPKHATQGLTSQDAKGASFSSSRSRFMVSVRRRLPASHSSTRALTFCPAFGQPFRPSPATCCAGTKPLQQHHAHQSQPFRLSPAMCCAGTKPLQQRRAHQSLLFGRIGAL